MCAASLVVCQILFRGFHEYDAAFLLMAAAAGFLYGVRFMAGYRSIYRNYFRPASGQPPRG